MDGAIGSVKILIPTAEQDKTYFSAHLRAHHQINERLTYFRRIAFLER